jgi:hypothetical protein
MNLDPFPLRGLAVGVSISRADRGIPMDECSDDFVNRITFQICSRFLFLGGRIVTGHMWRPGGIMEHLAKRACEFQGSFGPNSAPPIVNRVAWPDEAPSDGGEAEGAWLLRQVESAQVGPPGIKTSRIKQTSPLGRYSRIRALTAMRKELAALSDFSICLGGQEREPWRRLPGVVEEAFFSLKSSKPLFLSGAVGGVSQLLCDTILQRRRAEPLSDALHTPPDVLRLYRKLSTSHPFGEDEAPSEPGGPFDAQAFFRELSVEALAKQAYLSTDEYLALMTTPDVERALDLARTGILRGSLHLKRMRANPNG